MRLLQALQGDKQLVEGVVQTLLKRCLKGATYGDRWQNMDSCVKDVM